MFEIKNGLRPGERKNHTGMHGKLVQALESISGADEFFDVPVTEDPLERKKVRAQIQQATYYAKCKARTETVRSEGGTVIRVWKIENNSTK